MIYQILKQNLENPLQQTLMVDNHSEILEIESEQAAIKLCDILNANATDSKYYIRGVQNNSSAIW